MAFEIDENSRREVREFRKNNDNFDINHPNKWIRRLIAKKTTDEDILMDYALNDSFFKVRKEAIRKITDERFLCKVVLSEKSNEVKRLALRKIRDSRILSIIAQRDSDWIIRSALFDNIFDETELANILKNEPHPSIRIKALLKLDDEKLFENSALNDPSARVRQCAVSKITDGETLRAIAINDDDRDVRIRAIENDAWDDEELFKSLVNTEVSKNIMLACVSRLNDEEFLYETARHNTFGEVSNKACIKITSEELLYKLVEDSPYLHPNEIAASKIKTESLILELLKKPLSAELEGILIGNLERESAIRHILDNDFSNVSKLHAMDRLKAPCPLAQQELFDIISSGADVKTRRIAAEKFYDSSILLNSWEDRNKYRIVEVVSDRLLYKIAQIEEHPIVLRAIIESFHDRKMLYDLITNPENPALAETIEWIKENGEKGVWPFGRAYRNYKRAMASKSFQFLDNLIHSGQKIINLEYDIVLEDFEEGKYSNGIDLNVRHCVVDGHGHVIDARGKARIFNVRESIVLKNIVFKNANGKQGSAVANHSDLRIENCIFRDNNGEKFAALFNRGRMDIDNSKFIDNTSEVGGAICNCKGYKLNIISCEFSNNVSKSIGGAIYNCGNLKVNFSRFKHNSASKGGAIFNEMFEFKKIPGTRCIKNICYLREVDCEFEDNSPDDVHKVG